MKFPVIFACHKSNVMPYFAKNRLFRKISFMHESNLEDLTLDLKQVS